MNPRPTIDMSEATRLTQQGRLQEAVAILRHTLPGVSLSSFRTQDLPAIEAGSTFSGDQSFTGQRTSSPHLPEILRRFTGRWGDFSSPDGFDVQANSAIDVASFPRGAQFDERVYANDAGRRAYKLFVPSGYKGQAVPLVVMLHGCTQSPDDFAAGTRMNAFAEERTFIVAYPAQDRSANRSRCWNWFNPADQQRDRGEPLLLAGITRQIMRDLPVDPGRVYIAGLSAGGAAAAIMGSTYPDLYAGVGVHSGLACGAARCISSAFAAMRRGSSRKQPIRSAAIPTIVFHGDGDMTVSPVNGDEVIAQAKPETNLKPNVSRGRTAAGMAYTHTTHADEDGRPMLEHWLLHGAGHAWSGGSAQGSFTEPRGPDASREMLRFFFQQPALTL